MTAGEIAKIIGAELRGDASTEITAVAPIADAGEGSITFLASSKFEKFLQTSRPSCLIVRSFLDDFPSTQLRVENPHYAFARVLELFHPAALPPAGIDPRASVSPSARLGSGVAVLALSFIGENASIGERSVIYPGTYIGPRVSIGRDCVIHPNVSVREGVRIGDRVTIHSGTVIGSDGFGYVFEKGVHCKIPQVGGVEIGDDVEIGANVTIDRATLGATVIGAGTKIDNLVQIAHNVRIGEKVIIVAQVGIAGSSSVGDLSMIGGQAAIADHTTLEPGTMLVAQSGVTGHIEKGVYAGSPAIPHKTWLRAQALFGKLPEMQRRLRELEEKIKQLETGSDTC